MYRTPYCFSIWTSRAWAMARSTAVTPGISWRSRKSGIATSSMRGQLPVADTTWSLPADKLSGRFQQVAATPQISLSEQLKKLPPSVRSIVQAARGTVKAAAPSATEITSQSQPPRSSGYMWKIVRYAVDGRNVVGIGAFRSHAALVFYRGRELDDGSGLLQGGGKEARFVTLRAPADAERPAVVRMVRKAFKLGG